MAGVSTKEIKSRIRSMESTKQITKAMEMVAASKLRHAQAQILNSRPYFETFYETINDILASNREFSSPYLQKREQGRILYIVIAGDRGLAGGYNSNVLKMVTAELQGREADILPVGKKALDYFKAHGYSVISEEHSVAADLSVGDCFSISKQLSRKYLAGEYSEVRVAYTTFHSVLQQDATSLQLLPLIPGEAKQKKKSCGIIYEPDSEEVFAAIVPEYLGGILYGSVCESRASEQAARRTAMDSATSNAEDMIADLSLKFNRARQSAITQEITEIVAGS